ncbi:apoptosis-inducing factor 2 [Favolaschia claudopus]|uniref:Apoptosis-inducing factor 2 n=1 Tax=Favolaschia claudopus TaxID=2862362 RepID=A0AAW0CIC2_9AGAR
MGDRLNLTWLFLSLLGPFLRRILRTRLATIQQKWTYKALPNSKNVVVVGGSFAGLELVKGLAARLPSGFRVTYIEKNSHMNFSFNFPRFSVVSGYEHTAFIPYDGLAKGAPAGLVTRVQGRVVDITDTHVRLASGDEIDYEYLIIATGSSQPLPVQVTSTELVPAVKELQSVQRLVADNQKIAVIGAGAVGVELVTDIKSFFPEKDVTLVHSRSQVLNSFGKRLHDHCMQVMNNELKVRVLLNERPQLPREKALLKQQTLKFSDGREEIFDLVIACTGQRPNSALLASYLPDAISKETSRILVKPTLQISAAADTVISNPRIFAIGDVAEHGGARMARAAEMQSWVVLDNIIDMVHNRLPSATYKPLMGIEGSIKLTLGKSRVVLYSHNDGAEILLPATSRRVDLDIARGWAHYGANIKQAAVTAELVAKSNL